MDVRVCESGRIRRYEMTLLCERCYGPIDPGRERYVQLAHIAHADLSGNVAWNHASVHTDPCGPIAGAADADNTADAGDARDGRRAA